MKQESRRGILHPEGVGRVFSLDRHAPRAALRDWIDWYWEIHWNLESGSSHVQEVLPHPCINLAFQSHRSEVAGIHDEMFRITLSGRGCVLGVKFKPGAFYRFWGEPVDQLTGKNVGLSRIWGRSGERLVGSVLATNDTQARISTIEEFLLQHELRDEDERVMLACHVASSIIGTPELTRVEDVCDKFQIAPRKLQRLFLKYVGVSPKWVIRRARIHDAAERVARGDLTSFASLASDLKYSDQSHFVHDFTAQMGRSPTVYLKECRLRRQESHETVPDGMS